MKGKTTKWVFKWWCRCCSKGYLYESDLYLGKKEKAELGLGKTVALDLYKKLENTHCMLYFDNCNSPTLVEKLFKSENILLLVQFKVIGKETRYEKR